MRLPKRPRWCQQILAGGLVCLMLFPPSIWAQAVVAVEGKQAQVPAECLSPQSPPDFQACAQAIERVNPGLAGEIRQAAGQGDLQKAQALLEPILRQAETKLAGEAKEAALAEQVKAAEKQAESPFARLLASEIALEVPPFGYTLFQSGAGIPPPDAHIPVGPEYILGPEDEFTVTVWGTVDGVYKGRVNREGEVVFPRVGALPVAGLSFRELKEYLARMFTQQFRNVSISVAMGQLRSIQVFVVGEVEKPGTYRVSALTRVLGALFAAGGPTKNGTLRDIRVLRGDKVLKHIDLYDFLLHGDKSQDSRLQDQDTVFVPLKGPVVGIAGHVKRPAIYELKGPATLGEVLELAGGVQPTGFLARVQIERIVAHDQRMAVDLNLAEEKTESLTMPVQNMDLVKVFPIPSLLQEVVYLKGHVIRPGPYAFRPGMRISEVVSGPETLLPDAYLDYGRIVRFTDPERSRQVVPVNLRKVFENPGTENPENLALHNRDEIEIYSKADLKAFPTVSIIGEVRNPGDYPLLKEMRVKDLVAMAGGLSKLAYPKQAELTRYTVRGERTTMEILTVDLEQALAKDPRHDLQLQELDALAVRPIPESDVGRKVTVQGEVKLPGEYWIQRGERLSSVLRRAGGFTGKAYPQGLILIRHSVKQTERTELEKFVFAQKQKLLAEAAALTAGGLQPDQAQQEQAALGTQLNFLDQLAARLGPGRVVVKVAELDRLEGTSDDVLLEPGDQITVPQQPMAVTVLGAVRNPSSHVYRDGLGAGDYIQQAGGFSSEASERELYIIRADGSTVAGWVRFKQVQPGDSIVVPAKIEPKTRPLLMWQAIATIVGSLALTAAGIAVIGR